MLVLLPVQTKAETYIREGDLDHGASWTKENSPYILEDDVYVPEGVGLSIGEGVVVRSASTTDGEEPYYIKLNGNLIIRGSEKNPVTLSGLSGIYMSRNFSGIEYAHFHNTPLDVSFGTSTIKHSKLLYSDLALRAKQSVINISDSEISKNKRGILSALWIKGPALVLGKNAYGIGGIGNIEDMDPKQNIIHITESRFENNEEYSINNQTPNTIDARDNWWGKDEGPGESVIGPVVYDPWKKEDFLGKAECCSNVLFLPGLGGSRLYKDNWAGVSTDQLWEPNRNLDAKYLKMNSVGISIMDNIYTKDVIGGDNIIPFVDFKKVYKAFIVMMNDMVADKKINAWTPFAYDWRMSISDIVEFPVKYATTSKSLIEEVINLAETSKTGKVSIIAHSNGGLVAKMLGNELRKVKKEALIDKVIFVATPQLGTPAALGAILHGDNQSMGYGFLLKNDVAREILQNMPGIFGLLPSRALLDRLINPIITIATSSLYSYDEYKDFIFGKLFVRDEAKSSDLATPPVLSSYLFNKSEQLHNLLDSWSFGTTTTNTLSIVGWGMPTTASLAYGDKIPKKVMSYEGDDTVLAESAHAYEGSTRYFNQGQMLHDKKGEIHHMNILEAKPVRTLLEEVLATTTTQIASSHIPYISSTKPKVEDYPWMNLLVVSVHSPVDIEVYNSEGNHIRLAPLPDDPESDIQYIDDTIGARYEEFAGSKYITLPADGTYSVKLKGTGTGLFTFMVEKFMGGNITKVGETIYADLPVTPLLVASTTINALTISPPLALDVDGNGKTDISVEAKNTIDPLTHLLSIKEIVISLELSKNQEKKFIQRLDKLIAFLKKGKSSKIEHFLGKIVEKSYDGHWKYKEIKESDRESLLTMFENLLTGLENEIK